MPSHHSLDKDLTFEYRVTYTLTHRLEKKITIMSKDKIISDLFRKK